MRTPNKTSTTADTTSFAIGKNQNILIIFFTLIRIFIGWHFLYEGLIKLFSPWSSAGYLLESQWLFSDVFHWIAENSGVLSVVDMLNIAGMILIGVSLFLGLFTRISAFTGALLLLLYYIANPPFIGYMGEATGEGHYLIVNKQLIETALLFAIVFLPRDFFWSIDRWIVRLKQKREKEEGEGEGEGEETQLAVTTSGRREMVKDLIALPILGAFSWLLIKKRKWESFEELNLISNNSRVNAISSATTKVEFTKLNQLKHKVPMGKIKGYEISRLIFGGGIVSGYAHSRDLIYVSPLIQSYNNDEKVIETFKLCEAVGINTMILRVDNNTLKIIKKYRKRGGTLQWIAQCRITEENIKPDIDAAVTNGAIGIFIQGIDSDTIIRDNNIALLFKAIDYTKKNDKLISGVAAHDLKVIIECEKHGLDPDFYMKTFNSGNYWTAGPRLIQDNNWIPDPTGNIILPEYGGNIIEPGHKDNMWCNTPQQTLEYMKKVEKPWIAYKVLGAGAIHPSKGFKYAFGNGADFACVGMFDFQLVENANIVNETLAGISQRERPWRG
jgi:uncharacterized membrane protein YphA (DoxX/SURF4 family)